MDARAIGTNIARLLLATGGWIHVETRYGTIREGRLSGWTLATIEINGVDTQLPLALELNGDPADTIRLVDVVKLDVDPATRS